QGAPLSPRRLGMLGTMATAATSPGASIGPSRSIPCTLDCDTRVAATTCFSVLPAARNTCTRCLATAPIILLRLPATRVIPGRSGRPSELFPSLRWSGVPGRGWSQFPEPAEATHHRRDASTRCIQLSPTGFYAKKRDNLGRCDASNVRKSLRYNESVGVPNGIRTRVTAVKGRCPGPLDDGDA